MIEFFLRKNVQYWGGLHSNHRLVKWLWEIVENDFNKEEKSLFLKVFISIEFEIIYFDDFF